MSTLRPDDVPIAIVCALPEERAVLLDALEHPSDVGDEALIAHAGGLDGHAVVLAGSGVGKVQAAVTATLAIERFGCGGLVLSGVAGGLDERLSIGDLVVAERVIDVDYGRLEDGGRILYQPGSLPLPHLPPEPGYRLAPEAVRLVRQHLRGSGIEASLATIASGDAFLASPRVRRQLAADWGAAAIEMEGAAVCGVAMRFGVPWLDVRALSDLAGETSAMDFDAFVAVAAERAASLVRALLPVMAARQVEG